MSRPRRSLSLGLLTAIAALSGLLAVAPSAPAAEAAPAWRINLLAMPTNFSPGANGLQSTGPRYDIVATNVGGADAPGPVTVAVTMPEGITPSDLPPECSAVGQTVSCTYNGAIHSSEVLHIEVGVDVAALPDPTTLSAEASVSSPGTAPRSIVVPTIVSSEVPPFDYLGGWSGLGAMLTEADGSPASAAGSHPSQLTVNLGFATKPGMHTPATINVITSGGGVRDARTYLPPGLILNPSATPVRCVEAQYFANSCPDASAIGRSNVMLNFSGVAATSSDAVFNLVPPPGSAASLGFDPANTGLHVHVLGGLRPGSYALSGAANDLPSLFQHPVYATQLQLWGDPSSPTHDYERGIQCGVNDLKCPMPRNDVPALSLPTSCSGSLAIEAEIDSWAAPGEFLTRSAPFTDPEGNEAPVSGCNAVPFNPTLSVQPSTNLADSPTGLNVDLKVPQSESLKTTATAHLKNAVVTLPEGLVLNPSSANGLEGCSPSQIGIDPATGVANGNPAQCPNASKIGEVEVESPLLAQYDSENKVKRDAEGHAIPKPVSGAVYVATPHDNPFGSLLAIYLAVEDPEDGVLVKLAGRVEADPQTGRLTTSFADNPQLPVSSFKLKFFGGAAAALRTPLACGQKEITSTLTPWSSPEGADATPSDAFQVSAVPGGGPCPASDDKASNNPAFDAGTIAPHAGAYSPFVLKLSREDGSQPISRIDTTLPAGLTGKLAGIPYCSDAALAAAAAKSGSAEKASPSCPASSQVGTVNVGAGAGPAPYYTQGSAYLAGPYKGAPLSLAIVTPATAGPYDLGTVVVRTALNIDPETARIHAVSDAIPQILEGIPLDVRSVVLRMDRPGFVLNPTSCDPMELIGSAISPFGSSAGLKSPFQVGGCQALPFKPSLALSLSGAAARGSHPALKAVLTAKPGEANIAKSVVALPHSEFLEQAHIKTICTRVQFAANQCPAGSVYGQATAITPLLDAPLSGPLYLRSSSHPLPDLVADLNGQIHVVLVGRIDSVKGGIRTSFEGVPDAPVSKFTLTMQGGKKGLLVNSRNICKSPNRASVEMSGQNGKSYDTRPLVKVKCPKRGKRHAR